MKLTAVYRKVPEGFIAFVEELPGANAQGETLDELRENLKDIYGELTSGRIPAVHRVGELVIG